MVMRKIKNRLSTLICRDRFWNSSLKEKYISCSVNNEDVLNKLPFKTKINNKIKKIKLKIDFVPNLLFIRYYNNK